MLVPTPAGNEALKKEMKLFATTSWIVSMIPVKASYAQLLVNINCLRVTIDNHLVPSGWTRNTNINLILDVVEQALRAHEIQSED